MDHLPTVFAYLGPETMLPLTSVVAGVAGFLMMFGRNAWRVASASVSRLALPGRQVPVSARPDRRIGSAGRVSGKVRG